MGFFQPKIILPEGALLWSDEQLTTVFAHELGHISRKDYLQNLFIQLIRAIYWFQPFIWKAVHQYRFEAEKASDDLAIKAGIQPIDYAESLLAVAQKIQQPASLLPQVVVPLAKRSQLKGRLSYILEKDQANSQRSWIRGSGAAALLVLFSLPLLGLYFEPISYWPSPKTIDELISDLRQGEKESALKAAEILGRRQAPEAISELQATLFHTDPEIRTSVTLALGRYGKSSCFYDLRQGLADPHSDVRKASLWALYQIGCLPAFRHITDHLNDQDPVVSDYSHDLLQDFDRRKLKGWLQKNLGQPGVRDWVEEQFIVIDQVGTIELLIHHLANGRKKKKDQLRKIIQRIEEPGAQEELRRVL